jgi:hypothetical protein
MLMFLATAFASSVDIPGPVGPGVTVGVVLSDLAPGVQTHLVISDQLGSTCHPTTAPVCVDVANPDLIASGTPLGSTATVDVELPALPGTYYLQLVSSIEASELYVLEIQSPPLISGMLVTCSVDTADVVIDHFGGSPSVLRLDAYVGGSVVVGYDLTPTLPLPGQVFVMTEAEQISAPSCASLTWTAETADAFGDVVHCVVRGPEAQDLIDAGTISSACQFI